MIHHMLHSIDTIECANNNGECEHNCTNTEGSFYCTCKVGYILANDNRSCEGKWIEKQLTVNITKIIDIDECSENSHLCQHICYNTNGSYVCDCEPGFTMDSYMCIGIYKIISSAGLISCRL